MPFNALYKKLSKMRNRHFFILDFFVFLLLPTIALVIRLDLHTNLSEFYPELVYTTFIFVLVKLSVLKLFGFYRRFWHVASVDDMLKLLVIGTNAFFLQLAVFLVFNRSQLFNIDLIPRSIPVIDGFLSMAHLALSRFSVRMFKRADEKLAKKGDDEKVLIVGAGQAGILIASEIEQTQYLNKTIIGFVDDDPAKIGMKIRGLNVLGSRYDIPSLVERYQVYKIIIAMPSVSGKEIRDIVKICESTHAEVLTIPGLYDIIDGKIDYDRLRKVQIEDLLRRKPVKTDLEGLKQLIKNKVVLVTGGGGSIGSEICRQVIRNDPQELLILGHGENSVFEIHNELCNKFPGKKIIPIIADVSDKQRLRNLFSFYKIDFVFHAAAHKHVPLMESQPYEAVKNNVLGTKNLVETSVEFDVGKFIMISTDKAVNPTNFMGATKRTAELIVLNAAKKYNRLFSVVRFGNVLGSRGSVVRTFKKQIENGGPLTVTHPEITRFFMTIPEAVQLVLQAFKLGNGGEIFVLDMGKPVKILDLAKDIVSLSGLKLGEDIDIEFSGLRPGEKLFEELFIEGENYIRTSNEMLFKSENIYRCFTPDFDRKLNDLLNLLVDGKNSSEDYYAFLKALVPEFNNSNSMLHSQTASSNDYLSLS